MAAAIAAKNAIEMANGTNRESQAHNAIGMLNEARPHVWRDVEALFGSAPTPENNQLMLGHMLQAMCLETMLVRCLLEIDELNMAKQILESRLEEFEEPIRSLVHKCLGDRRATFFNHDAVTEIDLYRYIAIEQWLRRKDDVLVELVLAARPDFWKEEVIESSKRSEN